jgi:hypothetical protein
MKMVMVTQDTTPGDYCSLHQNNGSLLSIVITEKGSEKENHHIPKTNRHVSVSN